jgi:hypothetical protein
MRSKLRDERVARTEEEGQFAQASCERMKGRIDRK